MNLPEASPPAARKNASPPDRRLRRVLRNPPAPALRAAHQKQKTFVTATAEMPSDDLFQRYKLYQVAGLEYNTQQQYVTAADRLNGITYLGTVGFGFTLFRAYDPASGWSEWKDVDRPENILHYGWNRISGGEYGDPERAQQAPAMRFKIECRDGNWYVTTAEGARFINGTRRDDETVRAAALAKVANAGNSSAGGEVFKGEVLQPRIDFVAKISDEGTTLHGGLLKLSKEVAASPEAIKAAEDNHQNDPRVTGQHYHRSSTKQKKPPPCGSGSL